MWPPGWKPSWDAEGRDHAQIAERWHKLQALANTCSQLRVKLGATSLPELVRRAIQYVST